MLKNIENAVMFFFFYKETFEVLILTKNVKKTLLIINFVEFPLSIIEEGVFLALYI